MKLKRILIIEDDLSIAELEKDYLEMSGYSVEISLTGIEGLNLARKNEYDLIILDIMLPEIDGFHICKSLRSEIDIPILMVSAKGEGIDKIRGLGIGADDYITKPFSPSELVARVKAHIERYDRLTNKNSSSADTIEVNGLFIDKFSRRVTVDNEELHLSTKEFDILLLLASNPDRVFSKNEIFERIWGVDSLGDISTVTVHIRKIREKVESDSSNPRYIETIWGVGYRFKI
ncbi:DNA-binding response regulator, OmpR family, contains REC and winged-helix (wHTH) domain [Peptoclostridium litorale DSM 5388]|uniref:Stage 0 sporulation protein A homolog n=1 Tax=Peptoclostridium litorale DSM 5388 TaxID=1121324 RepID=A0A069RKM2_PEPLI|nr:response regulator [Peptoclostridium litorale DSM 5388]SIN67933.1 DNA-binding response regulator, OmpR family, contains REC and winged-helix (wHTH) domain [Peptoclostridium litorale DSM 5388]